jgi:hypothetical protein
MNQDQQFDKELRSKLENLESPAETGAWAAFEQRRAVKGLDPDMPSPVDKVVFNALGNLEMAYQPSEWNMMEARLDFEDRRRRRIWMTKLAEAAIFLLLVGYLQGLLQTPYAGKSTSPAASNEPIASKEKNTRAKRPAAHQLPSASLPSTSGTDAFWNTNILETPETLNNQYGLSETALQNQSAPNNLVSPFINSVANTGSAQMPSVLDPLPFLFSTDPIAFAFAPTALDLPDHIITKSPKQRNLYAGLSGSYDQNTVVSGNERRISNGYAFGATIGYKKGKWGIESGIAYQKKTFQPKKEIEIYGGNTANGFYGSFADKVDAEIVAIPVHATRELAHVGKTKISVASGATAHVAVNKSYSYKKVYYSGVSPQPSQNPPANAPSLSKEGKGLLENGAFNENFYLTADASIRIEHPIGKKMIAFVEPTVRRAISQKGIGPSDSRLHTLSFQAGVLTSL